MFNTFEATCRPIKSPIAMSYLTASAIILLVFTNIPGNILVILAVVLDPNKKLKNSFQLVSCKLSCS